MEPVSTVNAAILALDAILSIVNSIRSQGGMTDDAILAAAESQTTTNAAQIKALLASLPPAS